MEVKWPHYPSTACTPRGWTRSSRMVLGIVGICTKIWAEWMNRIDTYNKDVLLEAVDRQKNIPLITFCNHQSCFDDPVLWGVLKFNHLSWNTHKLRWTLAASDIVFTKEWHSKFFSLGRGVPVIRGAGVYQQAMDFMVNKLNEGEWVHTFPEGKINMDNELIRLKWGIGRLIADCKTAPLVIPMWHVGMEKILPNKWPYIPRIGKRVTLVIGDPLNLSGMVKQLQQEKASPVEMRKKLTDFVQDEFYKLKAKAEAIHAERNS